MMPSTMQDVPEEMKENCAMTKCAGNKDRTAGECGLENGGFSQWNHATVKMDTLAVHGGAVPDISTGAILTPIYCSTAFVQPSVDDYLALGYSYSRQNNPTVRALEKRIAALEGGGDALCYSSGMAAVVTVISGLLSHGDHCILTDSSYGGTNRAARLFFAQRFGIDFSYVDIRDTANVRAALQPNTRMIFSESPTNPVLRLCDIAALSAIASEHSAAIGKRVYHVCDSTFATPLVCKPMDLGADITCISTTKFYDGHNSTVGGALVTRSNDVELYDTLSLQRNILGNIMTPLIAFLQLQMVKTLPIRVRRQCESALRIAEALEQRPEVLNVSYPGLKSHPQHELALRQHSNNLHGAVVCFEIMGGTAMGRKLMDAIQRPWTLCENLGAAESIITCPSVFTHANMLEADRLKVGVTDGLIRLSVGLEDTDDLIKSLFDAFDRINDAI